MNFRPATDEIKSGRLSRKYDPDSDSGKVLTGLIAAETSASITLRRAEKSEDTLLRSQIESIQSTSKSLMPDGLEMQLPAQDLADLIVYLMGLAGKKEGN